MIGILMGLIARGKSGKGQVVESDMVSLIPCHRHVLNLHTKVSGTRYVSSFPLMLKADQSALFSEPAGQNILDGGAPCEHFKGCSPSSKCFQHQFTRSTRPPTRSLSRSAPLNHVFTPCSCQSPLRIAQMGSDKFVRHTLAKALPKDLQQKQVSFPEASTQYDRDTWPALRALLEEAFASRSRDEWEEVFLDTDSCVAPVLEPDEASCDGGAPEPAPFLRGSPASASPIAPSEHYLAPGQHTRAVLAELGMSEEAVARLEADGTVHQAGQRTSKL